MNELEGIQARIVAVAYILSLVKLAVDDGDDPADTASASAKALHALGVSQDEVRAAIAFYTAV